LSDLEEAEIWYASASETVISKGGRERFTVAVAQSIHSLIKANDALTMKYLGKRSSRHEEAAVLFGDLIKKGKISPKFADLRKLLIRAAAEKSNYDYKGNEASEKTASSWLREVGKFLKVVHEILGR